VAGATGAFTGTQPEWGHGHAQVTSGQFFKVWMIGALLTNVELLVNAVRVGTDGLAGFLTAHVSGVALRQHSKRGNVEGVNLVPRRLLPWPPVWCPVGSWSWTFHVFSPAGWACPSSRLNLAVDAFKQGLLGWRLRLNTVFGRQAHQWRFSQLVVPSFSPGSFGHQAASFFSSSVVEKRPTCALCQVLCATYGGRGCWPLQTVGEMPHGAKADERDAAPGPFGLRRRTPLATESVARGREKGRLCWVWSHCVATAW